MNARTWFIRMVRWVPILAAALAVGPAAHWVLGDPAPAPGAATSPATRAATQPEDLGPDVVMLEELVALYQPVPFDHKSHAKMAQMWDGCVTCHHRSPRPTTQPATAAAAIAAHTQDGAAAVPACRSCHLVAGKDAHIRMPNLKGAYHRQCLNCHQDWMHENACGICHKPRGNAATAIPGTQHAPTPDDIVGRMHPPIPEPDTKLYKTRYTPADGGNVLFRHQEHTAAYGFKCVSCHRQDKCSHCHDRNGDKASQKPVRPGMTWKESHGPCMGCHQQDHCRHCHYKDEQAAPAMFDHRTTGQMLDKDHVKLTCLQCHVDLRSKAKMTCGDAKCHDPAKQIAYPSHRPGTVVTTQPAVLKAGGGA
jgi:hypothetical protein